ncbi:uncharacterized protein K02A2.6-like [Phlebotomus papatasi]|uniref:uncharacterized protein K02A2.6-like n=1 Tax=Phlebotomus papatasi TaxID=29031 RepID=UPI002483E79B|nr:uncharacterized protein K02A2.6-like [Phlebotomus papatasi]XP_055698690.1 uncharacterized protein K02A2.6-like [Phlebotomus papatasi]
MQGGKFRARSKRTNDTIVQSRDILLSKENLTLDDIIRRVHSFGAVEDQSHQMDQTQATTSTAFDSTQVNQIQAKWRNNSHKEECSRCGRSGHNGKDSKCPALEKKCAKCQLRGHFAIKCRTRRPIKRSAENSETVISTKKQRIHAVTQEGPENSTKSEKKSITSFIYNIGDGDEYIWCKVGGVLIEMMIDSGASQNIIDEHTWQYMKKNGIEMQNVMEETQKVLRAYAQSEPLKIIKVFKTNISVTGGSQDMGKEAVFYVIQGGSQPLLGKATAKELGVLVLGLPSTRETMIGQVKDSRITPFPKVKGVKIVIPIDERVSPVSQHARRPPIALLDKVEEKLEELQKLDIIEPVNEHSDWVSPIVVIPKDNGDIRICVDMRQVNKAIKRENHMMPVLEDFLPRIGRAEIFSRLDIKNAFHQLELDPSCRYITTFITHKGMFRYKRLMFGISCAPEMFQKTMEQILCGCSNALNYIDDIIVFGASEDEHNRALDGVLDTLKRHNVLLNHAKCIFRVPEIDFLGHRISQKGISPSASKIAAILSFRAPKTKEEIRSFLGLITYMSRFLPDCSTETFPLRQLMCSSDPFKWEEEHQKAFDKLKEMLGNTETLSFFRNERRTRIVVDASPVGLGAVLIQYQDDTDDKPLVIAYASRSLSDTERRYCQTEKEALAAVWGMERFDNYLIGRNFELETDHKALEVIFKPTSHSCARIERWLLRLQSFQFRVIYRKGISNIADPLSRLSVSTEKVNSDEGNDFMVRAIVESAAVDVSEIEKASKEDSEMQAIRQALHSGVWSNILLKAYHPFKLELASAGDIVMRGSKLVVPEGLRSRMLQLAHEGHPGETLMKQRLRERVWWPGIDSDSVKVVRSCEGCILVSAPNKPEPMQRRALPSGPWIDLAMDFMSIPSGEHLLVVVDYFSRYKEVEVMHRITARETIERLDKIFTRLGYPRTLTLDNAKQFVSGELEEYCLKKGIHLNNTIPYWPQQNGEVERQNRSLLKRIKISHNLDRDWRKDLQDYLMCYYTTPHTTTGKTPTELCYGRTIRGKIPSLKDIETAPPEADFSDRDKRLKEKGKELEDTRRGARESDIEVGDVVLMKNLLPGNKLQATFGATKYVVLKRSGGAAIVRDNTSGKQYERNVAHLKKVVVSAESSTIPVEIVPEPEPVEEQPVEKISRKRTIPRKYQDFVVPSLNQKH